MNVCPIIDAKLCTACGACKAICPTAAITIEETASGFLTALVRSDTCIQCGKCLRVCPSFADNRIGTEFDDPLHGRVLGAYVGYAADSETRARGQSGGVVTAVLEYLLQHEQLDGALVNSFDSAIQRPVPFFAQTKEDLLASAGSYYVQSAMLSALPTCKGRFASVLLGCQSEGLELLRRSGADIPTPEYVLGLVCAGQNSGKMLDYLVSGKAKGPAASFRFREKGAGGWPGNVQFTCNDTVYTIAKEKRLMLKKIFESFRCLMCFDQMNVYADIVFGDPWGVPEKQTPDGYTVFITRTEKGESLIRRAIQAGAICVEPLAADRIFAGQTVDTRCRDKFIACRTWCQQKSLPHPNPPFAWEEGATLSDCSLIQKGMMERLTYTREFASLKDSSLVTRTIHNRLFPLQASQCLLAPFRFLRRCASYAKRHLF